MSDRLMLFVSQKTMREIKSGKRVEVVTYALNAEKCKEAIIRSESYAQEVMFVGVEYSHFHEGRHFIFLFMKNQSSPVQKSLSDQENQKGVTCV